MRLAQARDERPSERELQRKRERERERERKRKRVGERERERERELSRGRVVSKRNTNLFVTTTPREGKVLHRA